MRKKLLFINLVTLLFFILFIILLLPILSPTIQNQLNDSSTSKNFSGTGIWSNVTYIKLPKSATINSATLNLTGYGSSMGGNICYQESVNVSTECGGKDSGSYGSVMMSVWMDGDWDTSGASDNRNPSITYTKPDSALSSSLWRVKSRVTPDANYTIPSSCWNYNITHLLLRFQSGSIGIGTGDCYNGTNWINIFPDDGDGWFYEEAMVWNISSTLYPSNVTLQVNNSVVLNQTSSFSTQNTTIDFKNNVTDFLSTCTADADGFCDLPLNVSATDGTIQISAININYTINNPNLTIFSPTNNQNFTYNTSINLNYSATSSISLDSVWYNLDNGTNYTARGGIYYQEFANVSTFVGLSNGTYIWDASFDNPDKTIDGNWSTNNIPVGLEVSYLYINYTKPTNSLNSSLWQVKDSDKIVNLSILNSCWNYNNNLLSFRIKTSGLPAAKSVVGWQCYDGSWNEINSTGNDVMHLVYEESMIWNISTEINFSTSEGSHVLYLFVNDSVGNINSSSVSFFVDSIKPNVLITSPINKTNTTDTNLDINFTRFDTNLFSCSYSNDTHSVNISLPSCENITSVVWSEGNHNVIVWVNDSVGNQNRSFVSFMVDSINPSLNITSPINNSNYTDSNLDINFTRSDSNLQSCWFSNDTYSKNTTLSSCSNITSVVWTDDAHNVTIWVNDSSGNINQSNVKFRIDSTPPSTSPTMTSPPDSSTYLNNTWTKNNVKVTLISTDSGVGFDELNFPKYCLDTSNTCNPNTFIGSGVTISTEGISYIRFNASDRLNNAELIKSRTIKIDSIKPNIQVTSPVNNSNSSDINLDINFTRLDTNLFNCWYSNDTYLINTSLTDCNNITSVTWSEGNHNVTIWANDSANNYNSSSISFTIDSINPNVNIILPINNSNSSNTNLDIEFTRFDNNLESCWYSNDTYSVNTTLSNCGNITSIIWTEARHNVTIWVNDSSGHENQSFVSFTIDITNPNIQVTSPQNNSNSSNLNLVVNYTRSDTYLESCWYTRNNGLTNNSLSNCINITGITWYEGINNVTIWANDSSGNLNNSKITFNIDSIKPNIEITFPQNNSNSSNINLDINYTRSDINLESCWFSNDTYSINTSLSSCGNITSLVWSEGNHNVTIWNNDSSGNENRSFISFTIDTINPNIYFNPNTYENNTYRQYSDIFINITATDSNRHLVRLQFNNINETFDSSNPTDFWKNKTGLSEGQYNFSAWVNDSAGNFNITDVRTIYIDLNNPVIDLIFPTSSTLNYNTSINLNYTRSDKYLSTCWWALDGGTNFTLANCGNYTFNASEGSHTAYVYANDSSGRESFDFVTFVVSLAPPSVSLDYPSFNSWVNNSINLNFNITSSDATLDSCEFWENFTGVWRLNKTEINPNNGATTTLLINLSDGNYGWNVQCNNSGNAWAWGSPLYNFTVHVDSINPLISFTSGVISNNTNSTKTNISVSVDVTETNEKVIFFNLFNDLGSYNITNYTDGTRTINWENLPDDNYFFNVTILDRADNFNYTETRQILLDDTIPDVTILFPQSQNYGNNDSMSLNYSKSDFVGLKTCWYYILNSSLDTIISTTSLSSCENTTFKLPGGDIDYTLHFFAQDFLDNTRHIDVNFGIRTNSPAITLSPNNDSYRKYLNNHILNFSVTTNSDSISSCSLYHNADGTFKLNQTKTSITEGTTISFNPINLSEGILIWNINCSDNFGNAGWGFSNQTYIIDITNPTINISYINPTSGLQTFKFNVSTTDTYLDYCKYTIFTLAGLVDGINSNISFNCNEESSATATSYGTFNLSVSSFDKATNSNQSSKSFTLVTSPSSTSGGGGGGTELTVLAVALIKPTNDSKMYSNLSRAKIYVLLDNYCKNNSINGKCSQSENLVTQLVSILIKDYDITLTNTQLKGFINQFDLKKIESVEVSKSDADKYKLVVAQVVIQEGDFQVFPSSFDTFKILSFGVDRISLITTANKEISNCSVISGDVGFSCTPKESFAEILYELPISADFNSVVVKSQISYTSKNGDTDDQSVQIRIIRLTLQNILLVLSLIGIIVLIVLFRKKIKVQVKKVFKK